MGTIADENKLLRNIRNLEKLVGGGSGTDSPANRKKRIKEFKESLDIVSKVWRKVITELPAKENAEPVDSVVKEAHDRATEALTGKHPSGTLEEAKERAEATLTRRR